MTDPQVMRLLEEILESGGTPEEVCGDAPELLWEVRQRLKQCREVDAEIEAMFPASGPTRIIVLFDLTESGKAYSHTLMV